MLASNGQVAYLGNDPKSDGSGELLFSVLFSSFLGLRLFFVLPTFSQLGSALGLYTTYQRITVGVVINAQRAAAAAASDLDSDLSSDWWL